MNEFLRIRQLNEKMQHILDSVSRNSGRFSAIEKDLLTGYVRELYELAVSIHPQAPPADTKSPEITPPVSNNEVIISASPPPAETRENGIKRSITEIFSEKNGLNSVNERFKKQTTEVADKLKQTPIKDLKAYIGLNKRFAFIEALFNDREQEYEAAVEKVNSFTSYEEAVNFLRAHILGQFDWNPEEPLVNEFFTLVMRRYLK
jgi:hypothetical protein